MNQSTRKLAPLSPETKRRVQRLVEDRGDIGAMEALGIVRLTLAKARGGLELKEATRAQIEARLARLQEDRS